jgi:hypothetical protein
MVMNTRNIEVFLSAAEVAQESSGEGRGTRNEEKQER